MGKGSHAIFTLRVQQQTPDGAMKNGKLTFVDLAGSEKVHKTCYEGDSWEPQGFRLGCAQTAAVMNTKEPYRNFDSNVGAYVFELTVFCFRSRLQGCELLECESELCSVLQILVRHADFMIS